MPRGARKRLLYATALAALMATPAMAQNDPSLALPLDCDRHECFLQSLVDIVPGSERGDAWCGKATYDGHKGTDFRVRDVPTMKRGVDVLAVAPGTVLRLRDGVADRLMRTQADRAAVAKRKCGNGIVIDHGGGWTTQTCHLAKGSVSVKQGDRVEAGTIIGRMGLSGSTEFPHVHVTLRKGNEVIDPMLGLAGQTVCRADALLDTSLWNAAARKEISRGTTRLVASGFANGAVKGSQVMDGTVSPPRAGSPAVVWAHFINLKKGDTVRLTLSDDKGTVLVRQTGDPIPGAKATWTTFAGKRTIPVSPDRLKGRIELVRAGTVLIRRRLP